MLFPCKFVFQSLRIDVSFFICAESAHGLHVKLDELLIYNVRNNIQLTFSHFFHEKALQSE